MHICWSRNVRDFHAISQNDRGTIFGEEIHLYTVMFQAAFTICEEPS